MPSLHQDRAWRWIAIAALFVYVFLAVLMIVQRPGLYYDEALMVMGAVHMRHSPDELTLAHDPDSWIRIGPRSFPLMTMSYIGAIKEYVFLPLLALFGPRSEIIRLVSVFFSLFCIWGIGRLIGEQIHPAAGAAAAMAIAMNPAFVDMTVFDNGAVAVWMLALGLVCAALARYFRQPGMWPAFWIGAAMGLGVWARANFVWLIFSMLGAAVVVLRKRLIAPMSNWMAWIAGGIAGGLPFLVYQVYSKGGTWRATTAVVDSGAFMGRLSARFYLLAETLLSDMEHRAMWDGHGMPQWQHRLFFGIVLVGALVCLFLSRRWSDVRARWAQGITLTFVILALSYLLTNLRVAEHHLITLVPLAAIVTVLACGIVQARFRWGRLVSTGVALVYFGSALYWQAAMIQGLHRTRGVGPWSNGIFTLARDLVDRYRVKDIKVLDWGLGFNLFVLSDAKLHPLEIWPEGQHEPWIEEIRRGGVFVLTGAEHRQVPEPSLAFLEALARARPVMNRYTVTQRNGMPFAEIVQIQAGTAQESNTDLELAKGSPSKVELEGIYSPDAPGWRWSKREFAVVFQARGPTQLTLELFIADASIQKLGPITLRARVGDHLLAPQTFTKPGRYVFRRDLDPAWLKAGANRCDFSLDKALSPQQADGRELGIVIANIALEAR